MHAETNTYGDSDEKLRRPYPGLVTAFILAGGKSSRMGSDKAFVHLQGKTLLQRALQTAKAVTRNIVIIGDREKFAAYGRVFEDVFRERGPLGGIHSALLATKTDMNLVLAVDLPALQPAFLTYLCHRAEQTNALAIVPRAAMGWQPLCAVYRKGFGKIAEHALNAGQNKIDSLFAAVPVLALEELEITKAGFSTEMFRNLNTPGELKDARRALADD